MMKERLGKILVVMLSLALCVGLLAGMASAKVKINALFMKQAGYSEDDIRSMTAEFEKKNPNIEVGLTFVAYEELYDKIVVSAASGRGTYDVILVDCIWPAAFVSAGWLLDVTDRLTPQERADIFPEVLSAVEYKGRLYGMPWLNDWLYMYYNEDMLKRAGYKDAPSTWTEVVEVGKKLKSNGIVKYPYIEAWSQNESTPIEYLKFVSAFGGDMLDKNDNPIFNRGAGLKALEFMVSNLKAGIFHPATLESAYDEVRNTFSQGEAAFGTNWAYMYNLANDPKESKVAGHVRVTILPGMPGGRKSASINGGMGLAIMKTCKHPDEAWKYVTYLASKPVQKKYSALALPIWKSLYDDPDVIKPQPELVRAAKQQIKYIVNRPQVAWYPQLSQIVQEEVQYALTGSKTPQQALDDAVARVKEVKAKYKPKK
ncbi:MAG TPA: extracellular solute-binding protein [Firmicutes bacterium]|nr:extracellular solute-binding protein [Bacillota bacterium]